MYLVFLTVRVEECMHTVSVPADARYVRLHKLALAKQLARLIT